jgi:hypothetical protein
MPEKLRAIYTQRLTPEENEQLQGVLHSRDDALSLLDRPTRFLADVAAIHMFAARAECWLIKDAFPEAVFDIQTQLDLLDSAIKVCFETYVVD